VGNDLAVSDHAVLRYRQRVERIPRVQARRRLQGLAAMARWQELPRRWTALVLHPGTHYGYLSHRPDVGLLEREGVVVTVLSERFLRQQWQPRPKPDGWGCASSRDTGHRPALELRRASGDLWTTAEAPTGDHRLGV
jgi:hypothetical protein